MQQRRRQPLLANRAILLLGPTGSGKTPLGNLLAERGFRGARCVHFDFGANLRRIVQQDQPNEQVSREDLEFLQVVLKTGALLEDQQFPIAQTILEWFLERHHVDRETLVVLNGIPRHVGQAERLAAMIHVDTVIALTCEAQTVLERIKSNVGGDRSGRQDDDLASVHRKLEVYQARTAPLVAFYCRCRARILPLEVTATMTAQQAWQALDGPHGGRDDDAAAGQG